MNLMGKSIPVTQIEKKNAHNNAIKIQPYRVNNGVLGIINILIAEISDQY